MKITNHKLTGNHIKQLNCPKNKQVFGANLPDSIVIHYTAGSSAESSAKYLCKDNIKASAHLVVGQEGEIYQLVPFNTIAWHAGNSAYGTRKGYNRYSIGIEIDNPGVLTKTENGYKTWFGAKVDADNAVKAKHRNESFERYWHVYTEQQIMAVHEICELLTEEYNIQQILGHEEISPGRKKDPGPAFPLDKLRDDLLYNRRDTEEGRQEKSAGTVNCSMLNIRKGPGTDFEKLMEPLPNGTKINILQSRNGWLKVETTVEGWVSKDYVKI